MVLARFHPDGNRLPAEPSVAVSESRCEVGHPPFHRSTPMDEVPHQGGGRPGVGCRPPGGPGTGLCSDRREGSKHRPQGDDHRESQKGEGLVSLFLIHEEQYAAPIGLFQIEPWALSCEAQRPKPRAQSSSPHRPRAPRVFSLGVFPVCLDVLGVHYLNP